MEKWWEDEYEPHRAAQEDLCTCGHGFMTHMLREDDNWHCCVCECMSYLSS